MQFKNTGLRWLTLSLIILIADIVSKYLVITNFQLYESVKILPIFNLTYVRNYGAAFSFLAEHQIWAKYLFIGLAAIISMLLIYWLYKNEQPQKYANIAYACILGGAIANMADRIYNGFVIDFFDFYWDIYHYPIFNVADIAICIGAFLLILELLGTKKAK